MRHVPCLDLSSAICMKLVSHVAMGLLLAVVSSGQLCAQPTVVPGRVWVKFKPSMRPYCLDERVDFAASKTKALSQTGTWKRAFAGMNTSARARKSAAPTADIDLIYDLQVDPSRPLSEVLAELRAHQGVTYAEPREILYPLLTPNDDLMNPHAGGVPVFQWNLQRIQAEQAWDLSQGDTNVVIAVVDDGMQWWHYDLLPNIFSNRADPVDGIDNDGNGFVDDFRGWDFIGRNRLNPTGDNDPQSADTMPWRSGSLFWHGTVTTSFAAAATDNLLGGASTGWKCRFLPIKVAPDTARADSFALAPLYAPYEGVVYAADMGADIINCSWGGTTFSLVARDVITYATSKGALVVAAAGNSNSIVPFYPASYPEVLSVAATLSTDQKVSSSSFGPTVDVAAPGGGPSVLPLPWGDYTRGGPIGFATSWSAPQAAALAALLKAHEPSLTPAQLHARIVATADNIDPMNPGFEGQFGGGRINAYRALANVTTGIESEAGADAQLRLYPNPTSGQVWIELAYDRALEEPRVTVLDALGRAVQVRLMRDGVSASGATRYSLTISGSGFYILSLETSGKRIHQKIIVR